MSDSRLLIPDGVKPEFVLDNTEKRSCTIFPEESGCHRYQIFRSEDLPEMGAIDIKFFGVKICQKKYFFSI